jgi:hypothetical protein
MENTVEPNGAFGGDRIVALRDSEIQPLIDEAPSGPLSPSRSLLVERFDLEPTDWQTHVHMDQVLVLYLKSARVQYEASDREISQIQLSRGQFVICKRNHPESLRWQDPASLLCVSVFRRKSAVLCLCLLPAFEDLANPLKDIHGVALTSRNEPALTTESNPL